MKISPKPLRRWLALPLPFCFGLAVLISCSQAADAPKDKQDETKKTPTAPASGDLVPLVVKLPPPAFQGTPQALQLSPFVAPISDRPRPPIMVLPGLTNLATEAKLT